MTRRPARRDHDAGWLASTVPSRPARDFDEGDLQLSDGVKLCRQCGNFCKLPSGVLDASANHPLMAYLMKVIFTARNEPSPTRTTTDLHNSPKFQKVNGHL